MARDSGKECHTRPENSVCDYQAEKREVGSQNPGDTGAFPGRKARGRHVPILGYAAAVFTRACPMKNS